MDNVITLTTDFGLTDAYAAVMKGIITGINPRVTIIDISHSIEPQNIQQAAFVLSTAYPFLPERTIHIAVVDPGVGSERKAVILQTPHAYFIAPDNGTLSYIIESHLSKPVEAGAVQQNIGQVASLDAHVITNSRYWRSPVSPTFHGRDIFAPVAAHLSLGTPLSDFGDRVNTLTMLPTLHPKTNPDGSLTGCIIHIDTFGNCITNLRETDLPETGNDIIVIIGNHRIKGLNRYYSETSGLMALTGSSGHIEIALQNGSARDFLNAKTGDEICIA